LVSGWKEYGRWNDEELCLGLESPEVLHERERELRLEAERLLDQDCEEIVAPEHDELGLQGELIDYHHKYSPALKADIVFDATDNTEMLGLGIDSDLSLRE